MSDFSPLMGSQPKCTPNRIMHNSASQNVGVANPRNTKTVVPRSNRLFRWVAEYTPMGMAMTKISAMDNTLIRMVMGRRWPILVSTNWRSGENDRPKSSMDNRFSQFQYWT